MALTHIEKLVAKAVLDYGLLEEGDRILLGASGGKDSTLLAWALSRRQKWGAPPFHLEAVRIASDVPGGGMGEEGAAALAALYASLSIPYRVLEVPIIGRLKEGRSMNCYWCATQRRTELIRIAMEEGFNKIALGHHLDDILVTLLMNMTKKGEIATMKPRLSYDKYPLQIIRPLALVTEESIRSFAQDEGWLSVSCTCDFGADGERREYQKRLDLLCGGEEHAKRNLYRSLSNINEKYLVE
ncbi:tRNA 2-thiocytidine biosynthesis TtcA family protein [Treponema sp.]